MTAEPDKPKRKKGEKVRVPFRRNRSTRRRVTDVTRLAKDGEGYEMDTTASETVAGKGDISRQRTVIVPGDGEGDSGDSITGVVIATRGLFAEVDDGIAVWVCTARRVLRTRRIEERNPVTVGDRVRVTPSSTEPGRREREGVIDRVEPRSGQLQRRAGRRTQTIVANVDQAIIVSSAREPRPKPNLIDRYIVAAHAGSITPVVCMNKIDLDDDGSARAVLARYETIGYRALATSATTGAGIEELRGVLTGKSNVIAGQSGVGKSSLLNAVQPGLRLRVGDISERIQKGRHTTTTATLMRLDGGGYVVDTPGIRAFDISLVPRHELGMHFVEFAARLAGCKFSDCTHTHEDDCAIKSAVEAGEILPERYASYSQMFTDPGAAI